MADRVFKNMRVKTRDDYVISRSEVVRSAKVYNRRLVGVSVYFLSRHIAGQVVYYYNGCPTVNYFQPMLKACIRAAAPNGQSI